MVILSLFKANVTYAQTMDTHKWNDRLILILIDQEANENYNPQLTEFKKHIKGLIERKVVIYHIKPDAFKKGLNNTNWQQEKTVYKFYKKTDEPFEIVLVGLDGSVKLRQTEILPCKNLFSIIDSMPMRRYEENKK
ncbi:uncharacterized protein DUF4174 [Mariniflexile fucanivorans]|uniref:Uncharacterized protein DUF4174 n=2 Tax=Mariniflexile fucanivorans TaxID=264023 RepID=A0A4R1RQR6_9FLAO|nr:uncharacterized protein DUF4174 [Mariniflexile fucanivorans]